MLGLALLLAACGLAEVHVVDERSAGGAGGVEAASGSGGEEALSLIHI